MTLTYKPSDRDVMNAEIQVWLLYFISMNSFIWQPIISFWLKSLQQIKRYYTF